MSRRRGPVEVDEYAAFARRMIRAYGRRVGNADPEDLAEMMALSAELDKAIAEAIAEQREHLGRSWADIARAAGTTRSAAQKRWGGTSTHTEQSSPQKGTQSRPEAYPNQQYAEAVCSAINANQ